MESSTKRLNRWNDEPILKKDGTPVIVTIGERDLLLFALFNRYRFHNTDFIHALRGGNPVALQARLNKLYRRPNSYLTRPDAGGLVKNGNYRAQLYGITDKGQRTAKWLDIEPFGNGRHFPHTVMVNETIASIALAAPGMVWREQIPQATNRLKVDISYISPHGVASSKVYDYENDSHGPFGVRLSDGSVRFLSLEAEHEGVVDRETLEQSSFVRKFLSIQYIARQRLYSTVWGLPHLLTLVVCPTQHEIDQRKEIILRETGGKGCTYVLFQVVPSLTRESKSNKPMPQLFEGPWQRAGHPDFYLNQP